MSINSITDLIARAFIYWEAVMFMVVEVFQNSHYCFERSNVTRGNKYYQLFFLKWQAYFVYLAGTMSLLNTQMRIITVILSSK